MEESKVVDLSRRCHAQVQELDRCKVREISCTNRETEEFLRYTLVDTGTSTVNCFCCRVHGGQAQEERQGAERYGWPERLRA